MLRFDVPPVWSNVIRWEAFLTTLICTFSLLFTPWLMVLLLAQGAVRGFLGHNRCPSHILWKNLFTQFNWQGKTENAGAKMFANKILFLASSICLILFVAGSKLWIVPCIVLMVFSTAEWLFSFCAACWVYSAWYRVFPPASS